MQEERITNNEQNENDTAEVYLDLFNTFGEDRNSSVLNGLLVSMISRHSLTTPDDCIFAEDELMVMSEALEASTISDKFKKHWRKYITKGLQ